jgi:hypothetical protein
MDGKGAWRDNVIVERLCCSVKYEEVYLRAYAASAKLALRSASTSTSTISEDRIRALTASRPIEPTSTRCPSAWQPNHGGGSLSDAENLFKQPGPRQS